MLHLPGMRNYRPERLPHPPYTVFRSQFDAWFAAEAKRAGAETFSATLVEDLLWEGGAWPGCAPGAATCARVVVGADGVNSTVAEKSGLGKPPSPAEVSLIVRQVLDLPAAQIEARFALPPGEGLLSLYTGAVTGPAGNKGVYYTELYTNRDSLSMTVEAPLDVVRACGVPLYEVLAAREQHPHIAHLIQGATLREYQAHLIPWGGVADLSCLCGEGVLLAGDAGRFTTLDLKLDTLTFKPDPEPHIVIQKELCLACEGRPCVVACPAGLYVWENDHIVHNCDGCLECGTCRVVCPHGAIAWRYPLGGYGVRYRWG